MMFFVHLHDPTFFEPPWPGQRRLGPYETAEQATEQAASDLVGGAGEGVIGVFSEQESESMRQDDIRVAHLVGVDPDDQLDFVPEDVGPRRDEYLFAHAQDREWVLELVTAKPSVSLKKIQNRAMKIIEERDSMMTVELKELKEQIMSTFPDSMSEEDKESAATAAMRLTRMMV